MKPFKKLGLSDELVQLLNEIGFERPTEIQKMAIPRLLSEKRDLIGLAQTGTGKTAAFGLPLIENIDASGEYTQGLILSPTRELCRQINEQINIFSKYLDKINVLSVYGGAPIHKQIKALKQQPQHILVATPGRLRDLIKRKAVKLNQLRFLILDEADEMLNMGFKEELDEILKSTPDDKLTWLFSATMPDFIKKIVKNYMTDPIEIRINSKHEVNANIEHLYVSVKTKDKPEALTRFIDLDQNMRGLVFCRTKRETQEVAEWLLKRNYKADSLHGDLSQQQRDRVMGRFRKNDLQMLIATDVAARGIDVNDLTHVFHFNIPDDEAYYTHRSGRTARAGKQGMSIVFINGRQKAKLKRLENTLKISFEKMLVPESGDIVEIKLMNTVNQLSEIEVSKHIDQSMMEYAKIVFDEQSKEEIIAKLLTRELEKMSLNSTEDLNDKEKGSRGKGRNGEDDDRSSRRGRGRGRGRGRNSSRGKSDGRNRSGKGKGRRSKKKSNNTSPFSGPKSSRRKQSKKK